MVLIKTIHNRGSTIVVEAHGEILFTPGGDVGRWTRRLTEAIEVATQGNAPRNKRPRWQHYGKPLKSTFDSAVRYSPARMKVFGAVGSSAGHAAFVDQGTGVFAGSEPWEAKVLPPWRRGSPSLYEHTWVPPGSKRPVAPVLIQGQRGQFFFDKGIKQGFAAMRILSFEAPMTPQISDAVRSLPAGILSFLDQGNTGANPAFVQQLAEWRSWRDEAFNEGRRLGRRKGRVNSRLGRRPKKRIKRRKTAADRQREREQSAARSQRYRDRQREQREKERAKQRPKDPQQAAKQKDRIRFAKIVTTRYWSGNGFDVDISFKNGAWTAVVTRNGQIVKTLVSSVKFK